MAGIAWILRGTRGQVGRTKSENTGYDMEQRGNREEVQREPVVTTGKGTSAEPANSNIHTTGDVGGDRRKVTKFMIYHERSKYATFAKNQGFLFEKTWYTYVQTQIYIHTHVYFFTCHSFNDIKIIY
jgi:hypothetical protein